MVLFQFDECFPSFRNGIMTAEKDTINIESEGTDGAHLLSPKSLEQCRVFV